MPDQQQKIIEVWNGGITMSNQKNVWFVTGASKGMGVEIVDQLLKKDYRVVATARNPEVIMEHFGKNDNLIALKLDIKNESDSQDAVRKALEMFGRIDVLVNNAGFAQLGVFEEISEEQVREQMEVNVFGTMKVTRAVLPVMRKQGYGTLVTTTSMMGLLSMEGGSVYSASKYALEGWMDGLRAEVQQFGIRCLTLEPGPFRTDFVNKSNSAKFSKDQFSDYDTARKRLHDFYFDGHGTQPGDPTKLALALIEIVESEEMPTYFIAGKGLIKGLEAYYLKRIETYKKWFELSEGTFFE
jgi:NAD(P)-dependent dehydrogenase (short-subunit alcohol dehydrogenase family)